MARWLALRSGYGAGADPVDEAGRAEPHELLGRDHLVEVVVLLGLHAAGQLERQHREPRPGAQPRREQPEGAHFLEQRRGRDFPGIVVADRDRPQLLVHELSHGDEEAFV